MEDQKIIELIKSQKDEKAISKLYNYFPVIHKMVLANGGKTQDAEDVYQEGLIVLYRKISDPEFKLTSGLNTLLYSICRFIWNNQIRKQKKQQFVEINNQSELVSEAEFISEVETEQKFQLAEKVISELGERCKELLIMFYFQSLKLKDIAKKMGYTSENIAKSQRYKCLEAAKIKLKALKKDIY
jgi:RNA polymerase sigma factor (sigma-70 family)